MSGQVKKTERYSRNPIAGLLTVFAIFAIMRRGVWLVKRVIQWLAPAVVATKCLIAISSGVPAEATLIPTQVSLNRSLREDVRFTYKRPTSRP